MIFSQKHLFPMRYFAVLAAFSLLLCSSCASFKQTRWLENHRKNLSQLANSQLPAEQKLDGLLADYVLFMKEDLKFIDPVKGVKYVKKYHDQNEASMTKILRESDQWQGKLNTIDKLAFGVRVTQKNYIKDLIDLAPKFKRKYKQYAFAVKLAGNLTEPLTKWAGKALFKSE
jgi:hypothetical protein